MMMPMLLPMLMLMYDDVDVDAGIVYAVAVADVDAAEC